jgi:hypothetical protein
MIWVMPVQLLPFAGLLALLFAWPRLSRPTSHRRRFVEVLIIGLATSASCATAWAAYWWFEQRW